MYFPDNLIKLIMQCVSIVRFQILINGEPTKDFTPTRGVRQGDPLCPYLFNICAEGFSCLIKHVVANGSWRGIKVGRNDPYLSHVFFADDCLLFPQDSKESVSTLLNILHAYERVLGQQINVSKSSMLFLQSMSDFR